MEKGNLQIHSENILPIIKKWLYSERDIFVRELVSNASDAVQKTKILRDQGLVEAKDEEFRIDVKIDKQAKTLTFSDNGIGMDEEEVKQYIAQIAFSGAEEFIGKYQSKNETDQMIGHFGLGFYSAYMVADRVRVDTLSYKPGEKPVLWECDGSSEYEIGVGSRTLRGTDVILFIGSEHEECLDKAYIDKVLRRFCSFLPCPVYLDGDQINEKLPLWIKPSSDCTEKEYLEFYRYLYPADRDPLFWVHLNVDYPFHLKGILYFPKIDKDIDLGKAHVQLYCNRVFVSDHCKEVIPSYLAVLKGVIDSPDIPLNVSRSYLQTDKTVRQLSSHISKKVTDSLSVLYRNDREKFLKAWEDTSVIVKLGILEDEKFYERAKEFLVWKDVDGNWTTVQEYLEKNQDKIPNKIFYTLDEKHGTHFLEMYRSKGIDVLCAGSSIDAYLINFLESKLAPVKFQRIDAALDEHLLDKNREKTLLDTEGKTEASRLADFVCEKLGSGKIEVEAKSLVSDEVPGFVKIDEQERRMRDYMLRLHREGMSDAPNLFDSHTYVINTNNHLWKAIYQIDKKEPDLAKELVREMYDLSLLSQREMLPEALNEFVGRSNQLLGKLVVAALGKQDQKD